MATNLIYNGLSVSTGGQPRTAQVLKGKSVQLFASREKCIPFTQCFVIQ